MRVTRRQFLCGDVSGRSAAMLGGAAAAIKAEIGAACIAFEDVVCRSCGDVCEAQAIHFRLRARGMAVPLLDAEACTGCGDCIAPCPAGAIALRYGGAGVTACHRKGANS